MACPTCSKTILFGGIKEGDKKYCSKQCHEEGEINRIAESFSDQTIEVFSTEIYNGTCPECGGSGPIDVHKSYFVYSFLISTNYQTNENVLCKKCATKKQWGDLIRSFFVGWWGLPFGLIITPIMIIANIIAMFQNPHLKGPTKALNERSRLLLAAQQMEGGFQNEVDEKITQAPPRSILEEVLISDPVVKRN